MKRYLLEVIPERRAGRGRWWAPFRRGYTNKIENAGIYSEEEALETAANSDRTVAVPVEDAIAELRKRELELKAERVELEARIRHLENFTGGAERLIPGRYRAPDGVEGVVLGYDEFAACYTFFPDGYKAPVIIGPGIPDPRRTFGQDKAADYERIGDLP